MTISRKWLEALGYDLAAAEQSVSFGDASQSHVARVVLLDCFGLSGAEEAEVECVAHTLPESYGLDGIIGLNYLCRFRKVTLDFGDSVLTLDRGESVVPSSA
ncbi:MAG: hypothetical protein HY318_07340 [Armatimonadetes bacterium]|nr:hypothetical protein [Armatimonadota bacterium]